MYLTNDYLSCNDKKIFFQGVNSVFLGRYGRFNTPYIDFISTNGVEKITLSDVCEYNMNYIIDKLSEVNIPTTIE